MHRSDGRDEALVVVLGDHQETRAIVGDDHRHKRAGRRARSSILDFKASLKLVTL